MNSKRANVSLHLHHNTFYTEEIPHSPDQVQGEVSPKKKKKKKLNVKGRLRLGSCNQNRYNWRYPVQNGSFHYIVIF